MTIVIADLVANIRAEGVEETTQAVAGAGRQADVTARAFEIMAEKASRLGGGTATEWLENFKRADVKPLASALEQARQEAEKAAGAIDSITTATQRAVAAQDRVNAGFFRQLQSRPLAESVEPADDSRVQSRLYEARRQQERQFAALMRQREREQRGPGGGTGGGNEDDLPSGGTILRTAGALAGVSLGLSAVVGVAAQVHQAIVGIVDAQTNWERSLVQVHALYGNLAPAVLDVARAQAAAPGLLGSNQEFIEANLNASYLTRRFGLPTQQVTGLTSAAGAVSSTFAYNEQQRRDLQARALQFAESGGTSLRAEGIEGDPETIARRLGLASGAGLQALTPAQVREAQTLTATAGLAQVALQGNQESRGLLDTRRDLEKNLQLARDRLQSSLENGSGLLIGPVAQDQNQPIGLAEDFGGVSQAAKAAAIDLANNTIAIENNQKQLADANAALEKLGVTAGSAAARLLSFTGSLENPLSIARGDIGAQAQAAVASRAVGPNPLIYRTPAELGATTRETAEQQAYAQYVAEEARRAQHDSGSAIRQFLAGVVGSTDTSSEQRESAQRAIADIQRRYLASAIGGQAQQAGAFAQRAQTEANDTVSGIGVQQDQRRLAVAQELAGYRKEVLGYESQMAPLLLQQATLQDRMVVAARDNLTSRRALIQAEQQQLSASNVISQYDYEANRRQLLAEQSRATVRQGGAATVDINALRQEERAAELDRAASGAEINALDANRGVQVAQQTRTGEGLARDATLTNLEAEQRALDDQLRPLAEADRLVQARQDIIARTLEMEDLEDTKALTAARLALDSATSLALQAGAADRAAQDMAANMDFGATSAERTTTALEKSAAILKNLGSMRDQQADVDARILNGLGAGGIGPTRGTTATLDPRIPAFNISVTGTTPEQIKTQVHIDVEAAMNQFFAGMSTSGPPAPANVGGAGR